MMHPRPLAQARSFPVALFGILAVMIIGLWAVFFQSAFLIDALGLSPKIHLLFGFLLPIIPLFWFLSWNNSRFCLVIYTFLIFFGDAFSALCAPALMAATLPNCIYLMLRWRSTRLRFLVAPLVLLGLISFFTAIALGSVEIPVQLTNRMQFDPGFPALSLGWASSLLGFTIVYPLIYIPCLLYDLSVNHPLFLKRFLVALSVVFNGILLYGVLQFVLAGGMIRVSSIMRLPTRLGPFIVVFLTLVGSHLALAKGKEKVYWVATLMLSLVVLGMTQTRIAIVALGLVVIMTALSLVVTQSWRQVKNFIGGCLIVIVPLALFLFATPDLGRRFSPSQIESGNSSREKIIQDYQAGINLENVTTFQTTARFLFGYGMFRERQLAHFNLHDTLACALSVFGVVGATLYYIPYLLITGVLLFKTLSTADLSRNIGYAMACCGFLIFFLTGAFHNKLYSPIETAYVWLVAGFVIHQDLPVLLAGRKP
jgi:hypothetical protein